MKYQNENKVGSTLTENEEDALDFMDRIRLDLRADCKKCFGLCCIALQFTATDGFPMDKKIGEPCLNLKEDFRCNMHKNLWNNGFKGCVVFDCIGAGQKVSQSTFNGEDWRQVPHLTNQMFEVFSIMMQLHQLLWYLYEALMLRSASTIHGEIKSMFDEIEHLTNLEYDTLLKINVLGQRERVNELLVKASNFERAKVCQENKGFGHQNSINRGADFIGKDLRKVNLRGANLRGAYLIASNLKGGDMKGADLIGADFRDADIRGADLSKSFFLTQRQINAAIGDNTTKLPISLLHPAQWRN